MKATGRVLLLVHCYAGPTPKNDNARTDRLSVRTLSFIDVGPALKWINSNNVPLNMERQCSTCCTLSHYTQHCPTSSCHSYEQWLDNKDRFHLSIRDACCSNEE